ncbi:transcription factor grauzone-like [Ochlerotatus camptorhynchus]|uniref:transcription factor grauzone-like n=1 Tax=Ochlerotatus camptorhynchus TaxID=644619 RepID=UPI0031D778E8
MENGCSFCAETDNRDTVPVQNSSFEEPSVPILTMVEKHFWFTSEELQTFHICCPCRNKLLEFHLFYSQVEKLYATDSQLDDGPTEIKFASSENGSDDANSETHESVIEEEVLLEDDFDGDNESCKLEEIQHDNGQEPDDVLEDLEDDEAKEPTNASQRLLPVTDEDILLYCQMKCHTCMEQFDSFTMLKDHYQLVHGEKGYAFCCNCRFEELKGLREHIRVHMNPASFRCEQCQKNLGSKRSLTRHQLAVHLSDEVKPFQCESCSKKFAKQYQLNAHMIQHKERKEFQCSKCQKRFATNGKLQFHIRSIHDRVNEMMCDICSKMLKSKSAFQVHRAEHFNTTRVQCSTCDKWMKNEDTLRKHLIRHQEESIVIKCEFCGKQSPNYHALKKHVRDQHTLERTHQCTVCEKAFKRALALKEHMAIHTGQLLYSCDYCGKAFNSSANLCSHRKKKHPAEWKAQQMQRSQPKVGT